MPNRKTSKAGPHNIAVGDATKNFVAVLLLCCGPFVFCAGCEKSEHPESTGDKFEINKNYDRGPLTVHVRIDKSKLTIAQTFLLELEGVIEPGYELKMPDVAKLLKNFGIVDYQNLPRRLDPNNNIVRTHRYRLEPFLSGTYAVPEFTFEFYDVNNPEENKYELATEPVDIEVASLLGEDRDKLQIADIEGVVVMPEQPSYWWAWTLGAAAMVIAVGGWLHFRQKRIKKLIRIFRPAHEVAFERLRALVREQLIEQGKIKQFYERISNILRHYIEDRFELRAPERTTEEFLIEIRCADAFSNSQKQDLGRFLEHCDLVKFAKYQPTTEQIQQTFDLVKGFIEKTKSDQKKLDVTEAVTQENGTKVRSA